MRTSRRNFIKSISLGAAGLTAAAPALSNELLGLAPRSQVALQTGSERRQLAYNAIKFFESAIKSAIVGKNIVLKPNLVWHDPSACATHPDTLRGLLDFFTEISDKQIIIAEASASDKGTWHNYEQYGYLPLQEEYNAKLVDLNEGEWVEVDGIDSVYDGLQKVKVVKPFFDPNNWIMSVARMKTHWHMVSTLSVKNFIMASPWNGKRDDWKNQHEKLKMHGNVWNERNNEFLTKNIPFMGQSIWPDFAFVDGFEGMEGNGPEQGTPVDHKIALAGPDAVAVDRIAIEVMGINPHYMKYVHDCGEQGSGIFDCSRIDVVGENPANHLRQYQLADDIEEQIEWLGEPPPIMCSYSHITSINRKAKPKSQHDVNIDLPRSMNTHMAVFDLEGRKVRQILSHTLRGGRTSVKWDGRDDTGRKVTPGRYIIQLRTGAGMISEPVVIGR